MTEEEHKRLLAIETSVDKLDQKIDELHDLFLKPTLIGGQTMAQQMQELLSVYTSARWSARALLWGFGFIATGAAAYGSLKGWFGPGGVK